LDELSNGKGKLAQATEVGQAPHKVVEPMMMMMMMMSTIQQNKILNEEFMTTLMKVPESHLGFSQNELYQNN
jgi:hypothetical protein